MWKLERSPHVGKVSNNVFLLDFLFAKLNKVIYQETRVAIWTDRKYCDFSTKQKGETDPERRITHSIDRTIGNAHCPTRNTEFRQVRYQRCATNSPAFHVKAIPASRH
jgi:hypothetical protein